MSQDISLNACDICQKLPTNLDQHHYYNDVPIIFTSEQTGGSQCTPYISYKNLILCNTCAELLEQQRKTINDLTHQEFITANGAMGHNSHKTKKLLFQTEKALENPIVPVSKTEFKHHEHWH